ncbi:MAG: hypothetical protein ACIAXF_02045 [Phycisphaerales bacterium JB063]
MDYVDLAKDAVFALTDGGFLFPVLTYGVALMSAGALLLTLAHLLPLTGKSATRWAAVAVWGLVALAAGGALLIANDDLAFAVKQDLDAGTLAKITTFKTVLTWAWAAPLPAALIVLLAAAPKSAGARTAALLVSVVLGAGASVYALALVLAYQRTTSMAYEFTVDVQAELPESWRERAAQSRSAGGSGQADTEDGEAATSDANPDEPVQFFGLPIE